MGCPTPCFQLLELFFFDTRSPCGGHQCPPPTRPRSLQSSRTAPATTPTRLLPPFCFAENHIGRELQERSEAVRPAPCCKDRGGMPGGRASRWTPTPHPGDRAVSLLCPQAAALPWSTSWGDGPWVLVTASLRRLPCAGQRQLSLSGPGQALHPEGGREPPTRAHAEVSKALDTQACTHTHARVLSHVPDTDTGRTWPAPASPASSPGPQESRVPQTTWPLFC